MNKIKKTVSARWWMWLIAVDAFFVIITALCPHIPNFYGRSRLLSPFNLAVEMNVAAWWAGIGFIVLSFIAYELFCTEKDRSERIAWLVLSILLAGLFCDEIGSLHERIGSFSRLLPYGVVAVSLLTYSLIILYRRAETRKISIFIFSGFMLFGIVAFWEKLEHTLIWPGWSLGLRAGFEEGLELTGAFLIFWGIVMQRQLGALTSWPSAIPNLYKIRHINRIVLYGMFLHVIVSVILPHIIEMRKNWGNPFVLYPAAIYIMLSLGSLQQYLNSGADNRRTFAFVSIFFAVCSLGSMFNLLVFLPVSGVMLQRFDDIFNSLQLIQLAGVVFLFMKGSAIFENKKMMLFTLLALLIIGFMGKGVSMRATGNGIIAWLFVQVFLPQITRQHATPQGTDFARPEPASVAALKSELEKTT